MDLELKDQIFAKIDKLFTEEFRDHEYGYDEPIKEYIEFAKVFFADYMETISSQGYILETPHVTNSDGGGVTLEWRHDGKALYFDIEKKAEATKIWQEKGGTFTSNETVVKKNYIQIWEWLIHEKSGQTLLF